MGKDKTEYKGYKILNKNGRYELYNDKGEMLKATQWASKSQLAELKKYVDELEK